MSLITYVDYGAFTPSKRRVDFHTVDHAVNHHLARVVFAHRIVDAQVPQRRVQAHRVNNQIKFTQASAFAIEELGAART